VLAHFLVQLVKHHLHVFIAELVNLDITSRLTSHIARLCVIIHDPLGEAFFFLISDLPAFAVVFEQLLNIR
jgi:hypothetical protein